MAPKAKAKPSRALEGEDLKTSHWKDARQWMSIYAAGGVSNYVRRVRKILADLAIPVDLVNKPGRGYSLVFRPT
jgi:hypothetical protein